MEWEDSAIILTTYNYSDSLVIVSCLTQKHGLRRAAIKNNTKRKKQEIYIGNLVTVHWRGRLEEHLGRFEIRSCEFVYPFLYTNQKKLAALLSIGELISICLIEKELHSDLHHNLEDLIYMLKYDEQNWIKFYILLEVDILAKLGFGFDVTRCIVSGNTEDLIYLSPKTGKAVSRESGEAYKDKLFSLPKIFIDHEHDPNASEIVESLKITGHFLKKHLLKLKNTKLPSIRSILQQILQNDIVALE